ncbi:hypothetical protein PYCCODRAFT_1309984 [Trametes coccinea BRFM310]|uniref:Uncharacterized protein n=1 Tax=Trametes coccinea (strain BRFM310) TaxID=1353009 RepID=A0A1Y2I5J6_TRAC3|nr:hypothetical protein PYCCODRAFT_1309984 [Trametes coccinea BRFM310]
MCQLSRSRLCSHDEHPSKTQYMRHDHVRHEETEKTTERRSPRLTSASVQSFVFNIPRISNSGRPWAGTWSSCRGGRPSPPAEEGQNRNNTQRRRRWNVREDRTIQTGPIGPTISAKNQKSSRRNSLNATTTKGRTTVYASGPRHAFNSQSDLHYKSYVIRTL